MAMIKKIAIDQADKFVLSHKLWGTDAYKPVVYAQLAYDDNGFIVKFTVEGEANPLRDKKEHLTHVCEDSCVEFFANFLPKKSEKYFNFEVNANGCMDVAFRSDRYIKEPLSIAEIEAFGITPEIFEDHWTVTYKIAFDFIKKYYPEFDMDACDYIIGNLYKCGDLTEYKHYASYFKMGPNPDYHRPEYFDKFEIER